MYPNSTINQVRSAFAMTVSPKDDPLSLSTADLTRSLQTNVLSVVAAAHQATLGFGKLPQDAARTFIYTGNRANIAPIPGLLDLGISKAAAAHIIAHSSQAYQGKGYRYFEKLQLQLNEALMVADSIMLMSVNLMVLQPMGVLMEMHMGNSMLSLLKMKARFHGWPPLSKGLDMSSFMRSRPRLLLTW